MLSASSRPKMLPVVVCSTAIVSILVLVLLVQQRGMSPTARTLTTFQQYHPCVTPVGDIMQGGSAPVPPRDLQAATAAAARLAHAAHAALGYQGLAQLRQHLFCADAHPLGLGAGATLANVNNISMYVYSQKDFVSATIANGMGWETNDLKEVLWALQVPVPAAGRASPRDSPLFVDVGANVGWFALNVAAKGYRVAAFEGMRANLQLVRSSLCLDPIIMAAVTLYPFGLGPKKDKCFTFSGDGNVGDGFTLCGVADMKAAQARIPAGYEMRGSMDVERMDDVIKEDIKVMKMDVEGYEPYVLYGAEGLFSNHKVWYLVLEYNMPALSPSLAALGKTPADFVKDLQRKGYQISRDSFKGPWLDDVKLEAVTTDTGTFNLYCVLPEAIALQNTQ